MAFHCNLDDWDTAPILAKRAVNRKRPTHSGFPSQSLGAWPAAVASPTISWPWVCSTAEPCSLDESDVSSSSGAGTAQGPPYLSTDTALSICLNQPTPSVHAARYNRFWPVVDLTNCRSHASRCSSTSSAQHTTSSAVGLPTNISGKAKKQELDVQNTSVNTALGTAEHALDTFSCRHCEKTFSTRSTLRHHEIIHDPVRAHKYRCTTCQRGFRYPKDLKRHSSTHREVDEPGEYACPLCHKTFWRRDNLRRHQKSSSHSYPSKPTVAIDSPDAPDGLRPAKRAHAGAVERPAHDHDRKHQSRSSAGSNAMSTTPATDSHVTLPILSGPEKSSTKRTRKSSSDDEEDPNGERRRRKKPRKPLPVLCPFINCTKECKGGISVLLRHIRQVHLVDICIDCLKQKNTFGHELECQRICVSPACPYKTGRYHVSTKNCADQRRDEITIIKYGLVCEALGLGQKLFIPDSEQRCHDCQMKDATIARLTETITAMSTSIGPSQASFSQRNFTEPFDIMSRAYTQPVFPGVDQIDFPGQELPDPMSVPPQSFFTVPSSNAYQATQPGSYTQPSLRATTPTYMSQRETQTETSEAPPDSDIDFNTPKPSGINELLHDEYNLLGFGDTTSLFGLGDHFEDNV